MQRESGSLQGPLQSAGVTMRELDVFWLVADRLHNKEIAETLHISERTVESHVSSLLRKLGAENRLSLVDTAARLGNRRVSASLPTPLSSFVGRDREVGDLLQLVATHRLVTLTGPAGAGKTRLALHLARSMDSLPPAVLVDLATLTPDGDVDRVFADALGVATQEQRLRPKLRETLAEASHWLVVDNCEHVADSTAALLADLLAGTTKLNVLATSHGPLHVAGELVYEISPLPVPPEADDPAAVLAAASGRLFADRAAAAFPGFTVTPDNARAVAAVCRGLDGLPLAIELAAARLRIFSPAELLARLHDRLALLTGGAVDTTSRHRTLKAALQWSYDLLDDQEGMLFERCSVFPGNFDFDTAVEILSLPPLRKADVARIFPQLLDRSLVTRRREGQITEYRMLDSVRHFAHDLLVLHGTNDTFRERHARYHLQSAAALLADLQGANQVAALDWFDRQWPDLRAAMLWALEREETEAAWEFLAGVGTGWEILGVRGDLYDWLHELLEHSLPKAQLEVRAGVTAALLMCYQDTAFALRLADRAYNRAQRTDADGHDVALARIALGRAHTYDGDRRSAVEHLQPAVEEFRQLGDDWHYALALQCIGDAEQDPHEALVHLARSADLFGRLHDHVKRANCLNEMASRNIDVHKNLSDAQTWLLEARGLADETGNHHERLHAEIFQARLDQIQGQPPAYQRYARLLTEFRRIGDQRCASRCLLGLGQAAFHDGNLDLARQHLTECIEIADSSGNRLETAVGLRLLAESCSLAGNPRYAAVLIGASDSAAEQLDPACRAALPTDHEIRAALRNALDSDVYSSAISEGQRTSLTQVLTS